MRRFVFFTLIIIASLNIGAFAQKSVDKIKAGGTIKILHVMSFHSPWIWTDQQFQGFKEGLKDLKIEYKVIQLDAKKKGESEQEKVGKEAIEVINTWKPDLVFTSDDPALKYVTKFFINSPIPFVFSGMNKSTEFYGFKGSKNVIGVLEHEHFVPTVKMMQKMIPKLKKIAIFSDEDDATYGDIYTRINEKAPKDLPEISIVGLYKFKTFAEYKAKILEYNKTKAVDAIIIIGWFKYKDENGKNVDQMDVGKWTTENSMIPEASFWSDRVVKGNLCSVNISSLEQGLAAGKIARAILVDGKTPSSFQFLPTMKGQPVINLKRAKKLNIQIPSELLLVSEPIKAYEWEK